jgi:uncharacterized protein (DUF2252 family)
MPEPLGGDSVLLELLQDVEGSDPKLIRLKLKRMASCAFSFFRGSCPRFARDWNDLQPPAPGPELLVCGDLHLENFGAYRDDDGDFLFDLNDFDEAVIAPCAVDPVRCATSVLLAAELWGLSPLVANGLVLAYLDQYQSTVTTPPNALDLAVPRLSRGPIWEILGKTALASQSELLDHHTSRFKNGTRYLRSDRRRHPELDDARCVEVKAAVEAYGEARGTPEVYRVLDVRGRIAGIGSLGAKRYLVLIAGGGSAETNRLIDIKEEHPSAWLGHGGRPLVPTPDSEAARVVTAQRTLQARPTAGLDVLRIGGEAYRVREMIPEENRSSLDRFHEKPTKLREALVAAGLLTGLAHLRSAGTDGRDELTAWARGPAIDSVLAAAARFAERTRLAFQQFRADRKAPRALPEHIQKHLVDPK